jgi:hypothetical protein
LGYCKEREDDLKVIYHLLLKQDYTHLRADIQKGIVEFLLDSERLSKEQTSRLKKLSESFVVK